MNYIIVINLTSSYSLSDNKTQSLHYKARMLITIFISKAIHIKYIAKGLYEHIVKGVHFS